MGKTKYQIKTVDNCTASMLGAWGYAPSTVETMRADSKDSERERALSWVNGLVSKRGRDRGASIFLCGQLFPALLPDGKVVIMARPCRDRACPRCMHARSVRIGTALTDACKYRTDRGARLLFVTLTQPKKHAKDESAAGALDRVLDSWGRLTRTSSAKNNYVLRDMTCGGMRSIECVWSPRGKEHVRDGRVIHRVKFSGWHAHLHCIFEMYEGVTVEDFTDELRGTWAWACPGSVPRLCVNVQELDGARVSQCAKYCTKPFELPDERALQLFRAVESRHMMYGWGDWLAWSQWVEPTANPFEGAIMANETVRGLAKRWAKYEERGRGSLAPEPVGFLAWTFDEMREKQALTLKCSMPIDEIHRRLTLTAPAANTRADTRREEAIARKHELAEKKAAEAKAVDEWRGSIDPPAY